MGIACYLLSLSRVLFTHQLTHSDVSRKFMHQLWYSMGEDVVLSEQVLEQLQQLLVLTHLSISADPQ